MDTGTDEIKTPQDIDKLIQSLEAEDWKVRMEAAQSLGQIESERALNALLRARHDENSNVRWTAVRALEKILGERAIDVPLDSLEGDDAERLASLGVLQKIQDDRADETLRQADILKEAAKIPVPIILKYAAFIAVALALVLFFLAISQDWASQVILFGSGGLLLAALGLWLAGGRKG
ncbi:MAG: HEAT repeat domain-containing protein [Chloroflexia bacterium]|nr:HEAT repeat domain-containing protein [Chloroflexia bacterium]